MVACDTIRYMLGMTCPKAKPLSQRGALRRTHPAACMFYARQIQVYTSYEICKVFHIKMSCLHHRSFLLSVPSPLPTPSPLLSRGNQMGGPWVQRLKLPTPRLRTRCRRRQRGQESAGEPGKRPAKYIHDACFYIETDHIVPTLS